MNKLTKIRTLFLTILLSLITVSVFSQNGVSSSETITEQSVNNAVTRTANSDFENSTSYFDTNPSNSASNTVVNSSVSGKTSLTWIIVRIVIILALVVAAIYGMMFFFKKKNSISKSDDDFLRRVSSLTLAPGKTVEVVTLIDKGYILGVTDSNINVIDKIDDKELIDALNLNFDRKQNVKKPMNFADVLDLFIPNASRNNMNNGGIYSDAENKITEMESDFESNIDSGFTRNE